MPVVGIGLGLATLLGGGAAAGATIYATKKSADASKRAGDSQERSTTEALNFAREQDRLDREQYASETGRSTSIENELLRQRGEDRAQRDQLMAPYRNYGLAAASKLANLLGTSDGPRAAAPLAPAVAPPAYVPQPPPDPAAQRRATIADLVRKPQPTLADVAAVPSRQPDPAARPRSPRSLAALATPAGMR